METSAEKKPNYIVRRVVQVFFTWLVMAVTLFLSAGTLKWSNGWAFLILYVAMIACNAVFLLPRGTEIIEERAKLHSDAAVWDRWISFAILIVGYIGVLTVAGLDERYSWSPALPLWVIVAGGILMSASYGLTGWAMITNRFFGTQVRLQPERGHSVITAGPYRIVRHPGYLGFFLALPATALLLGSLWTLLPSAAGMVLLITRTALEDRFLREKLNGYTDYARKVRFRLIPGIW